MVRSHPNLPRLSASCGSQHPLLGGCFIAQVCPGCCSATKGITNDGPSQAPCEPGGLTRTVGPGWGCCPLVLSWPYCRYRGALLLDGPHDTQLSHSSQCQASSGVWVRGDGFRHALLIINIMFTRRRPGWSLLPSTPPGLFWAAPANSLVRYSPGILGRNAVFVYQLMPLRAGSSSNKHGSALLVCLCPRLGAGFEQLRCDVSEDSS